MNHFAIDSTHLEKSTDAAPESTTEFGILALDRLQDGGAQKGLGKTIVVILAIVGWLGSVAFVGQWRPSGVVRLVAALGPLEWLYRASIGVAAAIAVGGLARRNLDAAGAGAMMAAYLVGHAIFGILPIHDVVGMTIPFRSATDGLSFIGSRLAFGACVALPMIAVYFALYRRRRADREFAFGIGDWSVTSRDMTAKSPKASWRRHLAGGYTFAFCVPMFVILQAGVGFLPITDGRLFRLLPIIVLAAVANAAVEEIIYRGLMQPTFLRAAGIARGLWAQGMMFGMLHWGLSVGVIAALPASIFIGIGSVLWGKAALETRGLSWVIVAHALIDFALMSAYFVATTD